MRRVYVLIGPPAAGKSTWARTHAARLEAVVLATDAVRAEFVARDVGDPHDYAQVTAALVRAAEAVRATCAAVIFDATHWRRWARVYAREYARAVGAQCVAVWFVVPLEVCLARNAARAADGWGGRTDERAVRELYAALEPPELGEFDAILDPNDEGADS